MDALDPKVHRALHTVLLINFTYAAVRLVEAVGTPADLILTLGVTDLIVVVGVNQACITAIFTLNHDEALFTDVADLGIRTEEAAL